MQYLLIPSSSHLPISSRNRTKKIISLAFHLPFPEILFAGFRDRKDQFPFFSSSAVVAWLQSPRGSRVTYNAALKVGKNVVEAKQSNFRLSQKISLGPRFFLFSVRFLCRAAVANSGRQERYRAIVLFVPSLPPMKEEETVFRCFAH